MRGGGGGHFPLLRGRDAYISPTLTYHEGTILTIVCPIGTEQSILSSHCTFTLVVY